RIVRPQARMAELLVASETGRELARVALELSASPRSACLWLHGPAGAGKRRAAEALAHEAGGELLYLDAGRVEPAQVEETLRVASREAFFRRAFLHVARTEHWLADARAADDLACAARTGVGITILASTESLPAGMLGAALPIAIPVAGAPQRARCW